MPLTYALPHRRASAGRVGTYGLAGRPSNAEASRARVKRIAWFGLQIFDLRTLAEIARLTEGSKIRDRGFAAFGEGHDVVAVIDDGPAWLSFPSEADKSRAVSTWAQLFIVHRNNLRHRPAARP
jgi:hypothetical protein